MRIGSLFSGIGGLELGLEWAGVGHTAWQVERDPFCRQVLAKHWPDAELFNDVREVGAHNLQPVDVICGGFPCQDISYAGAGAGLAGERSGLWYEFARIVGELGPRYVVVENVAALLTRGLDQVLGTLSDLGYDAEWSVVRASGVGAPHRRSRMFLLAYRSGAGAEGLEPGGSLGEAGSWGWRGEADLRAIADAPFVAGHRWPQPLLRGVDARVPDRAHRVKAVGNSVVPQVAKVVGKRLIQLALDNAQPSPHIPSTP
jgi:DNA (cytosine-5)-methyltransferase 1